MRFIRNLVLVILVGIVSLKLAERFVLQPRVNHYIEQYFHDNKDAITVDAITFDGADMMLSGLNISGMDDDPFSCAGYAQAVLLGWPGVEFMIQPSGSKIWEIQKISGKATIGLHHIAADKVLIQGFRILKKSQFVIPEIFVSFNHDTSAELVHLQVEIPHLGNTETYGQIFVTGTLNPDDKYSGKLSLRVVNPEIVLEHFFRANLTSKYQFSAIKGLVSGLSSGKSGAEIILPLSIEKGALYLGPIRLYPMSSSEDNLARIGEGVINSLFRSFGKLPQ